MDRIDRQEIFYAHSKEGMERADWQLLEKHLMEVARISGGFAGEFGNGDWAHAAGLLHDIGKYNPAFQDYISMEPDQEESDGSSKKKGTKKVDHSTAGALFAVEKFKAFGRILSYLIAGHHSGLPDWYNEKGVGGGLVTRLGSGALLERIRCHLPDDLLREIKTPSSMPAVNDHNFFHLWIRMLYSCLVDADFLDTESFMTPEATTQRGNYETLQALKSRLDEKMEELTSKAEDTKVNRIRRQVLDECIKCAASEPGIFSLTVPTGGGKTLSAMAFALEHALKHGKRRVIMAIPFTSIIEQSAAVYKDIFGRNQVVEHHSNFDFQKNGESSKALFASENWDAPVIVTTNVQLFESLFAARSSSCRKIHNIVNSVIILDEAQTIPVEYLNPIINVLKALVKYFGVTLVLCTATQPALCGRIGSSSNSITGFEEVKEIISDSGKLADSLKRTEISFPESGDRPEEWSDLAGELKNHERVLCIVNTRRDCRLLHSMMPSGTFHLSAGMCPQERSEIIGTIKARLGNKKNGTEPGGDMEKDSKNLRVISTQLVEAGVDIDFPVVYRAMAGLDSIAQAAGRCNREGKMKGAGHVKVFVPPSPAPPGFIRRGQDTTRELLCSVSSGRLDFSPASVERYFENFYAKNDFDAKGILPLLTEDAHEVKIQFRTAARNFRLIDDSGSAAIVVWYEGAEGSSLELIERLKNIGPERWLLRKMQRFSVSVPEYEFRFYVEHGIVEDINGVWVQAIDMLYKKGIGVVGAGADFDNQFLYC